MSSGLPSGEAARLLGCTEPQLNDLIRRGRIRPAPQVVAGRRVWLPQHVEQAAALLGARGGSNTAEANEAPSAPEARP